MVTLVIPRVRGFFHCSCRVYVYLKMRTLKRVNKNGRVHVDFLTIVMYILCSVKLPVFSYLQLFF